MNTTRRSAVTLCTVLLLSGWSQAARAQFTVLSVSGSPASFTISTAMAGLQPAGFPNAATTYFVRAKNPAGPQRITARLDSPMPAGTTLTISLVASPGATSLGAVSLDATARDVVVNIDKENGASYGITYTFTATVAAGVVPSQSRTVTLTMSSYP